MRVLDLFCGGGGAAEGYARAGLEPIGVDMDAHPRYPGTFVRADWREGLERYAGSVDLVHASPPCQGYSAHVTSTGAWDRTEGADEPRLIGEVREALQATGLPYVIENVTGARADMVEPVLLCGTMYGLPIARHRLVEASFALDVPEHPRCRGVAKAYAAARGWEYRDMSVTGKGRRAGTSERWAEILDVRHPMTQHEFRESIPPAYAEWVARQWLAARGTEEVE